jgi:hypothetical protein
MTCTAVPTVVLLSASFVPLPATLQVETGGLNGVNGYFNLVRLFFLVLIQTAAAATSTMLLVP